MMLRVVHIASLCPQATTLRRELGVDLRVLGIATSKRMLLKETGISLDTWREQFESDGQVCVLAMET